MHEDPKHPLRGFAYEVAFWLGLVLAFLGLCVKRFNWPPTAIAPHLELIGAGLAIVWLVRVLVWRVLALGRAAHLAASAFTATVLLALLVYYILVAIGLGTWGKVISWKLIKTYTLQLPDFLTVMGMSPWLVISGVVAAWLLAFVTVAALPARWRWTRALSAVPSFAAVVPGAAMGIAIVALLLLRASEHPALDAQEPFSLTFFSATRAADLEDHSINASAAQREEEEAIKKAYVPRPDARKRNVVLIVLDALRADHMGVYDYSRDTTPFLSAKMRAGELERADRMVSVCSESGCGVLGLVQSRYVHQLSRDAFTLHQLLRRSGYRAIVTLGCDHTNFYGLRAAYGEVESYFDGSMAPGSYMNDDQLILDRLETLPDWDGKPTFLHFHMISTHMLGVRHPPAVRWTPAQNYYMFAHRDPSDYYMGHNYYDNGVLQADMVIQGIVETLQRKHYLDEGLVVVTADHGEMLGEFGMFGHAEKLHWPVMNVPFLLMRFGYVAQAPFDHGVASQIDVAPTILRELDLDTPPNWRGEPLQAPRAPRDFIRIQQGPDIGLIDLRDPQRQWKYTRNLVNGSEHVTDFAGDPTEQHELIATVDPKLLARWRVETANGALAVGGAGPNEAHD